MKRTIKWLFLLSLAAGVAAYMAYRWRRRGPGPLWEAETSSTFDTPEPQSEPVVVVPSAVDEPLAPPPRDM